MLRQLSQRSTLKLERLAEVLGIHDPEKRMAEILEKALDLALDKKDPKEKLERRRKRERTRQGTRPAEARSQGEPKNEGGGTRKHSRRPKNVAAPALVASTPPESVRQRVLERAGYRCEFRGPGGVRCTERVGLEIDHIEPYAKGGSTSEPNLRVLCKSHNLFMAAKEYGEDFMRRKMEERKKGENPRSSEAPERRVLEMV